MVIKDGKEKRYVLAKIEKNKKVFYFTMNENADIYFYTQVALGELEELGSLINGYKENATLTEIEYLNEEACYKIWFEDYLSKEEEEKYKIMTEEIKKLFLTELKNKIKENLYKFYIENNRLDLWKNSFEDRIFEIQKNKMYIDDKDFEIFYSINENGEYTYEFIKK